jgi:hypothetical protein
VKGNKKEFICTNETNRLPVMGELLSTCLFAIPTGVSVYVSTWRKRKNVKTMISTRWR